MLERDRKLRDSETAQKIQSLCEEHDRVLMKEKQRATTELELLRSTSEARVRGLEGMLSRLQKEVGLAKEKAVGK